MIKIKLLLFATLLIAASMNMLASGHPISATNDKGAICFDGTDNYAKVCTTSVLNDMSSFTIEAWVYWTGSDFEFLFGAGSSDFASEFLEVQTTSFNSLRFIPARSIYIDTEPNTFNPNVWNHIAVVYDPAISKAEIYINGVFLHVGVMAPSFMNWTAVHSTCVGMNIGCRYNSDTPVNFFHGKMDEFRLWKSVRTATQIRENMFRELPSPGTESDLVLYYKFNQGNPGGNNAGLINVTDSKGNSHAQLKNFNLSGDCSNWINSGTIFANYSEIVSDQALGSVTYSVSGTAANIGSDIFTGIDRVISIEPTNNNGLNATYIFHYEDADLNGMPEDQLQLYRSTDGGATWVAMGGVVDPVNNTITVTGVDHFSHWTAATIPYGIPTLPEWGLIILGTLFVLGTSLIIFRKFA